MSPISANPSLLDFNLCKEFKWDPHVFEDQIVELPSFKQFLKWLFGKSLKIVLRKGLEAKKIEEFITILDEERSEDSTKQDAIVAEMRLRSEMG